jgi:hypothetical protein
MLPQPSAVLPQTSGVMRHLGVALPIESGALRFPSAAP